MKFIGQIFTAIKQYHKKKITYIYTTVIFLVLVTLYIVAINSSAGLRFFLIANSSLYITLQFFFIILNSLLATYAILITIDHAIRESNFRETSIIGTILSLFISVGTSGCYVCGTMLIPFLGISGAFASLPFAGVEVKIVTVLMLLISLTAVSQKYLGICPVNRIYNIQTPFGLHKISTNFLRDLKFFGIMGLLTAFIFIAPMMFKSKMQLLNEGYKCTYGTHP